MCLHEARLLSFLMGCHLFASYVALTLCFPMLPGQVQQRGLDPWLVGVLAGVALLPSVALGCCISWIAHRHSRKCVYLSGLYLFSAASLLFAFLQFVPKKVPFIGIGIFLRLLIGLGTFFAKTILPAIMSKRFPKNMLFMFSYQYLFQNLALGAGPAIGLILYRPFQDMFWSHLLFLFVVAVLFLPSGHWMLDYRRRDLELKVPPSPKPSSLGATTETAQEDGPPLRRMRVRRLNTTFQQAFPLKKLGSRSLILLLILSVNVAGSFFWSSSLASHLENGHHKSPLSIALAYMMRPFCAVIASLFVPPVVSKIGGVLSIFFASLLHCFVFILFGPSQLLGLPDSPEMIYAALALKGVADPFVYIPAIPQITAHLLRKHSPPHTIGPISDVVVGFANVLLDGATFIAILLGFLAYQKLGFRLASDIYMLGQIPFVILFAATSGLKKRFKQCGKIPEMDRITRLNAEIVETERQIQEEEARRRVLDEQTPRCVGVTDKNKLEKRQKQQKEEAEKSQEGEDEFKTESFEEVDREMEDRERAMEEGRGGGLEEFTPGEDEISGLDENPPQTPQSMGVEDKEKEEARRRKQCEDQIK